MSLDLFPPNFLDTNFDITDLDFSSTSPGSSFDMVSDESLTPSPSHRSFGDDKFAANMFASLPSLEYSIPQTHNLQVNLVNLPQAPVSKPETTPSTPNSPTSTLASPVAAPVSASGASSPVPETSPSVSEASASSASDSESTKMQTRRSKTKSESALIDGAAETKSRNRKRKAEEDEDDLQYDNYDHLSEKERKLRRKAELARMQRLRKKTRMQDLENENARLKQELFELKKQLKLETLKEQQAENKENKTDLSVLLLEENLPQQLRNHMAALAESALSNPDPVTINKQVEQFLHALSSTDHAAIKQMMNLEEYVSPVLPVQFLYWLCSQPDQWVETSSSLWYSVFTNEVGLSMEQMRDLLALRLSIRKQKRMNVEVEKAYKKLATTLQQQMEQQNESLTRLRSILSPVQLARFFASSGKYKEEMEKSKNINSSPPAEQQQEVASASSSLAFTQMMCLGQMMMPLPFAPFPMMPTPFTAPVMASSMATSSMMNSSMVTSVNNNASTAATMTSSVPAK